MWAGSSVWRRCLRGWEVISLQPSGTSQFHTWPAGCAVSFTSFLYFSWQHRLTLKYFFINFKNISSLHFTLNGLVSLLSYYCKVSRPTLDWTLVPSVTEADLRDRSTVKTKGREWALNSKSYFTIECFLLPETQIQLFWEHGMHPGGWKETRSVWHYFCL